MAAVESVGRAVAEETELAVDGLIIVEQLFLSHHAEGLLDMKRCTLRS